MELRNIVDQILLPIVILAAWFVVMRFVLPRLGVST
jgi:hypothetical protein